VNADRFKKNVLVGEAGCWTWSLYIDKRGYGRLTHNRKPGYQAHRLAYELFVGPIPEGFFIDHLCWNTACCNPQHLRVLTPSESSKRQRSAEKKECINGHAYTTENTYLRPSGQRDCRECIRQRVRAYSRRRKAA